MSQNINLCDSSLRPRRDLLGPEAALAVLLASVVAVVAAAGAAHWSLAGLAPRAASSAQALQQQQAALQLLIANTAARPADTVLQGRVAAAQRTLLLHRAALQSLAAPGVEREGGFSPRLTALARQSVDGLWLTGMTLQQDNVMLKGRTLQPALIPAYVQRLDHESSLQGHAFKALDVKRPFDTPARSQAVAAFAPGASEPAPTPRAAFVEFTLMGTGSVELASTEKEARP